MAKEKLFQCFLEGVAMVIALYEICRTGKRKPNRRK